MRKTPQMAGKQDLAGSISDSPRIGNLASNVTPTGISHVSADDQTQNAPIVEATADRLRSKRVLLVGLGNIGSFLAVLLAPLVAFIRLVDRDIVELHNTANQFYSPEHEGLAKVVVTADRIERLAPRLEVERRVADLEDVCWEDFADVDCGLAGVDSLRARQLMSDKLNPAQIPYIDGAVGDPALARVQVLLTGQACLECHWSTAHYRQLATEYPCRGGAIEAPATLALGCAGAATAALMVAQCVKLFSDDPPRESYEINGDLLSGRFITSRRRRNEQCRFDHDEVPQLIHLETPFAEATITSLLAAVMREFGQQTVRLEFRRGILDGDLFEAGCFASPEQLTRIGHRRLDECGLMPRDRIVVRASGPSRLAHLCFHATHRSLS